MGEPDQVADDRGDRRAPSPSWWQTRASPWGVATDLTCHLSRELHDVAVHQEEARQAVKVDEAELRVEPVLGVPLLVAARLVQLADLGQADLGERLQGCFFWGTSALRALEVGELVAQILGQVERGAALGDQEGVRERLGSALEAMAHLPRLGEVEEPVGPPGPVCAVERRAVPDRDETVLEPVPLGAVVVDVARGDDPEPQAAPEAGERLVAGGIPFDGVVLQLHEDVPGAERRDEPLGERLGVGHRGVERSGDGALRAPRQQDQPLGELQEGIERKPRVGALRSHVGLGEEAAQVGVAPRGFC